MPAIAISPNQPTFVDLNDESNDPVVIATAHITYVRVRGAAASTIGLSSGETLTVKGTVAELAAKIWPR